MGTLRFLLSRRWVLLALAVVVLATLAWQLGNWQFGRLEDRRDRNDLVRANEAAAPVAPGDLLSTDRAPAEGAEWRRVVATGEYAPEDTVVVRYRTRDGQPGVEVVTPLVPASGPALLVDRGWLVADNGAPPSEVPAPPPGRVTVTGYVRRDAEGEVTRVTDGSTRAIGSAAIGAAVDREVYRGFLQLSDQSPPAAQPLPPAELPELDDGPHFFYGLQWWFFGLLAVFGFGYLARDEWRRVIGRPRRVRGERPQRDPLEAGASRADPPPASSSGPDPSPEGVETSSRNWVR